MSRPFKVKDIVFLAVLAAITTLFGALAMPVMKSTLFGVQTLVTCLFYSLFAVVGLRRVRKPGALTLFGLFTGFPLLFMAPVMFFNNFIGALLAEALATLLYRGYEKKAAVLTGASLFMILTMPLSLPFSMWLNGKSHEYFLSGAWWQSALVLAGVIVLSTAGALTGWKIADELQKAGKLRPYGEA